MQKEEKLKQALRRSKYLYKWELFTLKVITYWVALIYLLNVVLSYFNIETDFLSHIGGASVLLVVYLYISSFSHNFCRYHRIPLHYVVVNNILTMLDYYIGIPIDDRELLELHLILAGIAILLVIYLKFK